MAAQGCVGMGDLPLRGGQGSHGSLMLCPFLKCEVGPPCKLSWCGALEAHPRPLRPPSAPLLSALHLALSSRWPMPLHRNAGLGGSIHSQRWARGLSALHRHLPPRQPFLVETLHLNNLDYANIYYKNAE